MTSFKAVSLGLLTISCISGQSFADTTETDWGIWAVDQKDAFSAMDTSTVTTAETLRQAAESKEIEIEPTIESEALAIGSNDNDQHNEIIYGSGVIGSDENLLHELDQSSLLDYQYPIDGEFMPGNLPQDQSLVTTPSDQELDLQDAVDFDSEIDSELEVDSEIID